MKSDPGLIHVSDGPVGTHGPGRYEPVPTACPECGRKVVRRGNGRGREVYCSGQLITVWDGAKLARKCYWRATVFHSNCAAIGGGGDAR